MFKCVENGKLGPVLEIFSEEFMADVVTPQFLGSVVSGLDENDMEEEDSTIIDDVKFRVHQVLKLGEDCYFISEIFLKFSKIIVILKDLPLLEEYLEVFWTKMIEDDSLYNLILFCKKSGLKSCSRVIDLFIIEHNL